MHQTTRKETDIGQIPQEWEILSLDDLGNIITGSTPPSSQPEHFGDKYPFITPSDFKSFGKYVSYTNRYISEIGKESNKNRMINKDSIIVTCIGSDMGKIAISKEVSLTNQQINSISEIKGDYDINFVYYFLVSIYGHLKSLSTGGSTMPIVNKTDFSAIPFVKPPLPEQKAIASILGSLDDKIELLREQNKTLEAIGQTIFKEWFGKCGIEDELPEDWRVGKLGEIIESTLAGDRGKDKLEDDFKIMVHCMRGADIDDIKNGGTGNMPVRFIKAKNYNDRKLIDGDIVVEISGGSPTQSTGRSTDIISAFLNRFEVGVICSNFCRILRPKTLFSNYLSFLLQYLYNNDEFFSFENGTTGIKNLDLNSLLKTYDVCIPEIKIIEKFNQQIVSARDKVQYNGIQIQSLTKTRDRLLPRLMSGKLRV